MKFCQPKLGSLILVSLKFIHLEHVNAYESFSKKLRFFTFLQEKT